MLTILPIVKRMNAALIALCGKPDSTLGRLADVCLNVAVDGEACPLNLAPTASTAATLAMGDALAIAILNARDFTEEDFARSHPGGALGRRLLLYVRDIMQTGDRVPWVNEQAGLHDALLEMSSKGLGMTGVVDPSGRLVGIFTDGDLRRALNSTIDIYQCGIGEVMTPSPKTTRPDTLAVEVVKIMRDHSINGIFVVDEDQRILGAMNMHDLFRTGII